MISNNLFAEEILLLAASIKEGISAARSKRSNRDRSERNRHELEKRRLDIILSATKLLIAIRFARIEVMHPLPYTYIYLSELS